MRILAFLVFGFGIALAGGGVFFVSEFLKEQRAGSANLEMQTVRVLVAKQKLAPDTVIGVQHLKWVDWPRWTLPPGAFTSTEALLGDKADQKRYVRRTIEPSEPILDGKVWGLGESGSIQTKFKDDMRAVAIQVNAVTGVAGFVTPGDRVDILYTRKTDQGYVSSVPLADIEILAVDQSKGSESVSVRVSRTVTVMVTTKQAQKLAIAQQIGKLSLILRGTDATTAADNRPVQSDELDDLERAPAKKNKTIKVNRPDGSEDVPVN